MSRIQYGKKFLALKRGTISIEGFLKQYTPLDNLPDIDIVEESALGKFVEHEKAHASVLSKVNIRYDYVLSKDKTIAATVANPEDMLAYALKLEVNEFIDFLIKYHRPTEDFIMDGTDLFIYKILTGELDTEEKIEAYVISNF